MPFPRASGILLAVVTAVVATLPVAAPAVADDSGIRVVYSDLNLSTPAGVKALYSRIQAAAVHYCEPARITTGTRITSGYDLCVRDAVALAVRKVNVPGLTALHADRSGGSRKG